MRAPEHGLFHLRPECQVRVAMPGRCRYRSAMFESLSSFSNALKDLPPPNTRWRQAALERQKVLLKPPGSLGRLEEVAIFLAGWGQEPAPSARALRAIVFAGNHGITAQNVSPYPPEVTAQMVQNFKAGGAASNALTREFDIPFDVIPLKLDQPTHDITTTAAMNEHDLLDALNTGANAVIPDDDILILGEMGIGNTTIAAALAARSLGGTGRDWSGPGTGLDTKGVTRKAEVVDRALSAHAHAPKTALDTLQVVGGRETAAIAGAIVAARLARIPVLLDGYVVCTALAPLFQQNPKIVYHCLAGHLSAEPAHKKLLKAMSLEPILDLHMRLGEATGAILASTVLRAACATHNEMATFDEGKVKGRTDPTGGSND